MTCSSRTVLCRKKLLFEEETFQFGDKVLTLKKLGNRGTRSRENTVEILYKTPVKPTTLVFFCDWYPQLFGIDEDEIPESEYGEGLFDYDWTWDDNVADEKGSEDLEEVFYYPKYGRRARQKPILKRGDEEFECICDIDKKYSRHYVPHFGGGVPKEGEEFLTPHFGAFWENFNELSNTDDADRWSKIFEKSTDVEEQKGVFYHPAPKFPSSNTADIQKFRQQILSSFRPLDCREVRRCKDCMQLMSEGIHRYRMPYAEALYLELQEDNHLEYAAFFKQLIIKDHFTHQSPESGPRLRDNRRLLNRVVAFVKLADKFHQRQEHHKETIALLRSGKYFNDYEKNWWWLAEEFYTRAVKVSKNSVIDGGKAEAIANYILGTFLLDYVERVQPAQEHLLRARELSIGKDWTAEKIMKKKQDPVYKECANHLCRALIAVSKELRRQGKPEEALPHIRRSHKLCEETRTSRWDIEMETYFELGRTYQEVGYLEWAKVAFRKFIQIGIMQNCTRSVCDGYLELAICYRTENDLDRCLRNLRSYLKVAETNNNENLIAFGNRYLGEFYLNNGNSKLAVEHFKKAFFSFLVQSQDILLVPFEDWEPEHFTLTSDLELTRVLTGLAEGELLTKPICQLILEAKGKKNQHKIQQLINWKNNREKVLEQFLTTEDEMSKAQEESEITLKATPEPEPGSVPDTQETADVQEEAEELRTVRFNI